ncbi:calcium/sodium antiporter [Amaricoccus tamworthensis]|uniref:calcium/sodium antiporter n=1 Tax=Amaricoccus tamworthensis TaxID=57002 RepID=UPI003C7A637B
MDIVIAVAGLVILLVGGDMLVRGAVALSLRMNVPAFIVALTVVAFGTSAPELLIGVNAALNGLPGIAVGNVVGSNIANILLVLGVPAIISGIPTSGSGCNRNYVQMVGASFLLIALCWLGPLHFWHAAVLLVLFGLMIFDMVRSAREHPGEVEQELGDMNHIIPLPKTLAYLVAGIVGLPLGAHLLIVGATEIAVHFGISDSVIGLTMVAIGTSLPELATTTMAAIRKQADVVIGNVLGSNLFNILSILGVTSLFGPIDIAPEFLDRDLWVMLVCALILGPFVVRGIRIGRRAGIAFLVAYVGYMVVLFQQGSVA